MTASSFAALASTSRGGKRGSIRNTRKLPEMPTSQSNAQRRTLLLTGASRGIGAATARLFAAHGALVGVNYHRSEREAFQIVQEIEAIGYPPSTAAKRS